MEEERKELNGGNENYFKQENFDQTTENQLVENQTMESQRTEEQVNPYQMTENKTNVSQLSESQIIESDNSVSQVEGEIKNSIKNEVQQEVQSSEYNKETEPQYEEVQPQYVEVEIKQKHNANDSYFDGKLFELIGYRILHFIISIFSIGIASPWSRCMLLSYRINHTVYNGKRLKFEGTGGSLFGLRLKWFFLTLITFGIYLFFKPVSKLKWIMSNIHFDDEPFVKEESYFSGNTFGLILVNILCNIINILTLGLLSPFTYCTNINGLLNIQ